VAKLRGVSPTTAEVISVHLLNFKPILTPFEKNCEGDPIPVVVGGALARLDHSLSREKIRGHSTP